jgi:hypothetical protein
MELVAYMPQNRNSINISRAVGVHRRIMFGPQQILKKWVGTGFVWLKWEPMAGCYEHRDKSPGFIKVWEFLLTS